MYSNNNKRLAFLLMTLLVLSSRHIWIDSSARNSSNASVASSGRIIPLFFLGERELNWCYNQGFKKTAQSLVNTLVLFKNRHCEIFLLLKNFVKQDNFRKFKVALNPIYRICVNFAKSCISSCASKLFNKKKFHRAVFEI